VPVTDIFEMYLDVVSSGWCDVVTFTVPEPGEATTLPPGNTPPTLTPGTTFWSPNFPSPDPGLTHLFAIVIATVCLITIPLVILAFHYGQRKTKK